MALPAAPTEGAASTAPGSSFHDAAEQLTLPSSGRFSFRTAAESPSPPPLPPQPAGAENRGSAEGSEKKQKKKQRRKRTPFRSSNSGGQLAAAAAAEEDKNDDDFGFRFRPAIGPPRPLLGSAPGFGASVVPPPLALPPQPLPLPELAGDPSVHYYYDNRLLLSGQGDRSLMELMEAEAELAPPRLWLPAEEAPPPPSQPAAPTSSSTTSANPRINESGCCCRCPQMGRRRRLLLLLAGGVIACLFMTGVVTGTVLGLRLSSTDLT
ncbi:hypothetical protein BOX15_Mlig026150g1 [Macrostomum lignano]|uniref:Uncharacterized protein n=1 Tax=Macrostomum lignano TaxID=282301 RepID=A0A267FEX3_9PLAT|nr:hypothetical protein BOX15_Mlig026150g1 [Macrostomum lignano]